ncbi:hypothetical protein EN871_02670 [bacterium M00.F.Ca.ET.228.01.1.1]|uniref:hypothetical protein n=1 Tax=Paraburkholderia phenoliruptrix TaxID=252970 RepID=UPI001092FB36|nr:hypothetical protein [Paraburkholderia phenoliruptrix]TGP47734.1 hypothetical protein EN871_02670 [bacterium M00.F.Ca.ET.228.01.1.1]TGS05526.1 hypothetical protein EN834_02670 [bacterium M00.F.Ca.ET.191.01.1.1]TGU10462.1 hypothetical protein EN798_02670 [bacterium M00.F.Ca.ET.155.01.1.1]MBW0445473.1 hypothetical protein [Paraburkholderia phenoliruptrix]MBW9096238.1 hypothetical protein [Paraburkholderia phenoliruptrix]
MTSALESSRQEDQILQLEPVPHPAADAAEPFIVASDRRVIVAYPIAESDFERFGPFDPHDDPFCAVLFPDAVFHRLGPPGERDLQIHPLASNGLTAYCAHEVIHSSLVDELSTVSLPELGKRHFVITFMESTFECVASDYTVVGVYGAAEIASREAFALVR